VVFREFDRVRSRGKMSRQPPPVWDGVTVFDEK
jgi:hypothetical protein